MPRIEHARSIEREIGVRGMGARRDTDVSRRTAPCSWRHFIETYLPKLISKHSICVPDNVPEAGFYRGWKEGNLYTEAIREEMRIISTQPPFYTRRLTFPLY